ncbi:MAG: HAD family hydrolase [Candidatus Omnitrophota bacterium]
MKVVFLDRDGVINEFPGYRNYVTKVKDFKFLPGSLEAIKLLTENGYAIFVISNQAGISKGVYSLDKLNRINRRMIDEVRKKGGRIKKVFYCIHRPEENCDCRKPQIGSVVKALQSLKRTIKDAKYAYFVGDARSDIEAGHNAKCKTIFVLSGREPSRHVVKTWAVQPDYIKKDLLCATRIILNENSHHPCLGRGRSHKSR